MTWFALACLVVLASSFLCMSELDRAGASLNAISRSHSSPPFLQLSLILSRIFHIYASSDQIFFKKNPAVLMQFSCHMSLQWTRKKIHNLRGKLRNNFLIFRHSGSFCSQILNCLLVKPALYVKPLGAYTACSLISISCQCHFFV